jgi:hypothetical protein
MKKPKDEEMSMDGMTVKRRLMLIKQQQPWSEKENKKLPTTRKKRK